MARTSPIHYIAPSALGITPNANGSANDLAVYVTEGAKMQVYSPKAKIDMVNGTYREWSLSGRNRRLKDSSKPYTIYARLPKDGGEAYLVFVPKILYSGLWLDKYPYVTENGVAATSASAPYASRYYWYVRLGDVSLPEGGARAVTLDTGILGTEQFNTEWALNPDALPLRIDIGCTIDDEDAGPTPYVYWEKALNLLATLVEGWTGTEIQRFDHWEIKRDTGNPTADASWPGQERAAAFATTGAITLTHSRGANDDFNSAVSTVFTVIAWGHDDSSDSDSSSSGEDLVVLKTATVNILAETIEKYEMSFSASIVSFNPQTGAYNPGSGVAVRFRATDQRGEVFMLTKKQFDDSVLVIEYAPVGSSSWIPLTPAGAPASEATVTIPVTAFVAQQSINVRLKNADNKELATGTIAFVRDGEDSKEREWIFLRSAEPIDFGTSGHPYPSAIDYGEVNPSGAARHITDDKDQDGWVPEGWWDEMQGTDEDYPYEYGCYRDYVRNDDSSDSSSDGGGYWGAFTNPTIWSHFGKDGKDGKGAATCFFEQTVLNVPVDTSLKVLEDYSIDVPFYMIAGKDRLFISSAEISEDGTLNYGTLSHNSLFVPDGQGSVSNHKAIISGQGIYVEGHKVIINNKAYRYAYTMVSVRVKKGTVLDEHNLSLNVIAEDADGAEYAGYASMVIQGKYVAKDGVSVKRLDLDNEMDAIQTDSTGKVIGNTTIETVVRLYDGEDEVTINNPTVSSIIYIEGGTQKTLLPTITADGKGKKLSWTFSAGWLVLSRYEIEISYPFNGTIYTAKLSLVSSMGQAIFQLQPSLTAIPFARNSSGEFIDESKPLTLQVVKLDGGTAQTLAAATYGLAMIRYSFTAMPATASAGTAWPGNDGITVANTVDNVFLALFDDSGAMLDRETVPVIKDGRKGVDGTSAFILDLDNEVDAFGTDSDGKTVSQQVRTTGVKMLIGTALQTLTNLTAVLKYDNDQTVPDSVATVSTSYSGTSGTVTVTILANQTISAGGMYALVTGICAAGSISARFTLQKVMSGAPGVFPDIYQLAPTNDSFPFGRDNSGSLTPSSRSTTIKLKKTDASGTQIVDSATGYTYNYGFDNGAAAGTALPINSVITVTAGQALSYSQVWVELIKNNVVVDRETLPILKDGAKGADSTVPGPPGSDSISVIVSPASLIVNQSLQNPSNLDNLSEQILFSVVKGDSPKSVTKVEIPTTGQSIPVHCTVDGSNSYYATLRSITKDANNKYYDTAEFTCKVYYVDDGNTKSVDNVRVKIYANLLGTWAETVEADVKREVATAKFYFRDEDGNIVAYETIGDYIKSSTANIARLQRNADVYAKLTDNTECMFTDVNFSDIDGKTVHLKKGTYLVYAHIDVDELPSGTYDFAIGSFDFSGSDEEVNEVITVTAEGDYSILLQDSLQAVDEKVYELYVVEQYTTSSEFKQTTDGISMNVSDITPGKNVIPGALSGLGWASVASAPFAPHSGDKAAVLDSEGYITAKDGAAWLYRQITIKKGTKYTLSFNAKVSTDISFCLFTAGTPPTTYFSGTASRQADGRHVSPSGNPIRVSGTGNLTAVLAINISQLRYPQLELGTVATDFIADTKEISSGYKQLADTISLGVQTEVEGKLVETGINISGANRTVTAKADNFTVKNSSNQTTFYIDEDGNLKSTGDARFEGKVFATSGEFNGKVTAKSFSSSFANIDEYNGQYDDGQLTPNPFYIAEKDDYTVNGVAVFDGIWNLSTTAQEIFLLPTDRADLISQRITIYSSKIGDGGTHDTVTIAACNSQGVFDYLRGIGKSIGGGELDPIPLNAYKRCRSIEFCDGIVEVMCVPPGDPTARDCEWVVINIGTRVYDIHENAPTIV